MESKSKNPVNFHLLSTDQIKEIHYSSLEILEKTGTLVQSEEALKLLQEAGCRIKNHLVKFPPHLVEWAIDEAPARVPLYDRLGNKAMTVGGHHSYFGLGPTVLNIWDSETGDRRKFLKEDTAKAAKLVDALPNIDWVMGLGTISDVPYEHSDRHEFEAMVKNTTKPIVVWNYSPEGLQDILKMAEMVAGSKENLIEKPFIASYSEPISPLTHNEDSLNKVLRAAEYGIPIINTPCGQAGASAPVTIAGLVAQINAECLSGLVIAQLKRKGVPFFIGGVLTIMDMSNARLAYGAPEKDLASAAFMGIAHYYGLPTFGTAGCSDSKIVDGQAAIESAHSCLFSALSGANLIHDVGFLECANTGSLEMILMTNEIIGHVKRIMKGIKVNDKTLGLDVIDEIGPGGNFLAHKHTVNHFKKEFWEPTLMDRRVRNKWVEDGSKRMAERATEKVNKILKEHQPEPLTEEAKEKIEEIMAKLQLKS